MMFWPEPASGGRRPRAGSSDTARRRASRRCRARPRYGTTGISPRSQPARVRPYRIVGDASVHASSRSRHAGGRREALDRLRYPAAHGRGHPERRRSGLRGSAPRSSRAAPRARGSRRARRRSTRRLPRQAGRAPPSTPGGVSAAVTEARALLHGRSVQRRPSAASPGTGTFQTASSTMARLIFEPPTTRSTKMIGISRTRKPARIAR